MGIAAAVLYSAGKDSTYAIQKLREEGCDVVCLISMISENPDSYMLHTANIQMTELGARALEIPLVTGRTAGRKEEELVDVQSTIFRAKNEFHFDVLGCGGIASVYQKTRIEKLAKDCGLTAMAPLWGIDQEAYMRKLALLKYSFILTSVSAEGLDERWLGRIMDEKAVEELISLSRKFGFNVALEGGEGETLVLDCPLYSNRCIKIVESNKKWERGAGILEIFRAELIPKSVVERHTRLN